MTASTVSHDSALPLVSVVMPAYNARPYIEQAVRSVLDQDYPHVELIVVDDGSRDGTPEAVEALFGDRVRVLRQQNGGPAAARNRGIDAANGTLLAFLDADDVWLPGKLQAQVSYILDHPDVGLVYGKFLRWESAADGSFAPPPPPEGDGPGLVEAHSGWIYRELLFDNIVHIITALVRKTVLESVAGLDESLRTGEDYDLWLRVSRQTKAGKLNRTLAYYRVHAQSTTQVPRPENNEYKVLRRTLAQHGLAGPDGAAADGDAVSRRLFQLCFSHGYFHYWQGSPAVAQAAFREALDHRISSPKACIYCLLAWVKRMRAGSRDA